MAYYSRLQRATYHIYSNCSVGNNMVNGNLRRGKPKPIKRRDSIIKKPKLCRTCEKLRLAHKGIPGIPILPKVPRGSKVKTYYSSKCPQIFHICKNCFLGQNIESKNLIKDQPPLVKDGKEPRLCKVCTKDCIIGECMVGTPIPAQIRKPRLTVSKPKPSAPKPVKVGK